MKTTVKRLTKIFNHLRKKHCLKKTCIVCDSKNDKGECLNHLMCETLALVIELEKKKNDGKRER